MDALVLAGGLGTRLRDRVPDLPKPMAPVAGRPFLEHVLAGLARSGVTRAVLSIGHLGQVVSGHFGDSFAGLELEYSAETSPLGTGGAVRHALPRLGPDFVLVNGDTFVPLDLDALVAARGRTGSPLALTLCDVPDLRRFGAVVVRDDLVRELSEKGRRGAGLINAGAYLVGEGLRSELATRRTHFSFEREVLEPLVAAVGAAYVVSPGPFIDIGVPDDYERAGTVLNVPELEACPTAARALWCTSPATEEGGS